VISMVEMHRYTEAVFSPFIFARSRSTVFTGGLRSVIAARVLCVFVS